MNPVAGKIRPGPDASTSHNGQDVILPDASIFDHCRNGVIPAKRVCPGGGEEAAPSPESGGVPDSPACRSTPRLKGRVVIRQELV